MKTRKKHVARVQSESDVPQAPTGIQGEAQANVSSSYTASDTGLATLQYKLLQ